MEPRSFEGTWEEILRYAPELTGRRVRLTVLSHEASSEDSEQPSEHQETVTLDQVLKDRVGRVQFQPSDLSTRTTEAFTDLLVEKYRLQGLEP